MPHTSSPPRILLTGASGYVGGRLLKVLEGGGFRVRCLSRNPEFLSHRAAPGTEVVRGDVLDAESIAAAMQGIETAYYLVHALGVRGRFVEEEYRGAIHFAAAARQAGVKRIIYLGGLGPKDKDLSEHLASRHKVGNLLRASGVQVIEFRASIIIGSGSLSFEMVRSLVEKLPVMIVPRWVRTLAQPIAIEDVLAYLVEALTFSQDGDFVFEIGGRDRVSYLDLLMEYARQRGLHRLVIPVPVLTPWLSSLWLGLVTPIYARVGRKIIESVRHESVVTDRPALRMFTVEPRGVREAIARALANEEQEFSQTHWADALSSATGRSSWGGVTFGTRIVDSRVSEVKAEAEKVFHVISRIGGKNGWYFANGLWRLRGFMDLLAGGVGLSRGRRHPSHLVPGDALDFWRVEKIEVNRLLGLKAEMRLPGRAWLQFEIDRQEGKTLLRQTAIFDPRGLAGLAYWYLLYPVHRVVFAGMLRTIIGRAESPGF